MKTVFQLLDCDYTMLDGRPLVRLFGRDTEGKSITAFMDGDYPYFYAYMADENFAETEKFLKDKFSNFLTGLQIVEKFLPFKYQEKKSRVLKIMLKDPSQVPIVRDEMIMRRAADEIFEADILYKYRYMADHGLNGMKWYELEGRVTQTTTTNTERKISVSSIMEAGDAPPNLKIMGLDIEIAAPEGIPDSTKDEIIIISLSFSQNFNGKKSLILTAKPMKRFNDDILSFKNEKEMLENFMKIVQNYDPDVIVGYNINNFDLPYIFSRLAENKMSRLIGRCNQKPAIAKKIANSFRNSIPGRVVVDVYELVKESASRGLIRLKRYGLGDVSRELIADEKVDVSHGEILSFWNGNEEQNKKLIDYARKDAELVLRLLVELDMLDKFVELSKVTGLLLQDVLDGGEATRVENILLREFNKKDYIIPLKPSEREVLKRKEEREAKGLKGALVLDPVVGLHTNSIIYLDFKSMYPSIFISYNICPTTLLESSAEKDFNETPHGTKFVSKKVRVGIMPEIVEMLIKERDRVKSRMKISQNEDERKLLDAKQEALKRVANSFYGYTGYVRARLYLLQIANAITSCGRFLIQKTSDIVEKGKEFKVIYGDTDSIMVDSKTKDLEKAFEIGAEIERKVNREMSGIVQIKIESVFKTLLILTKKRYAGLSVEKGKDGWKEKIVMKGIETVRRDWCDLTGETLSNILEIILKDQDPRKALDYMKGIVTDIEKNNVPIEKLIITKSVSKSLKDYKGIQPHIELVKKMRKRDVATAPGVGDRVSFVIVRGAQMMSERAEDPEYVKRKKLKIDSKYYIESQLLPPLERVFDAIGISKTELMSLGRQMILSDAIRNGAKKQEKQILNSIEGFVCDKCNQTHRRVPLIGKCSCGGEFLFYSGDARSRFAI